jgi:hypothetical protein
VTGRRSNQLSYNSSEKVVTLELNLGGFNRKFSKKRKVGPEVGGRASSRAAHGVSTTCVQMDTRRYIERSPIFGNAKRFPLLTTASQARQRSTAPTATNHFSPITSHCFINSATDRSICRSRPSATLLGSFMTSISGSTWVFSM